MDHAVTVGMVVETMALIGWIALLFGGCVVVLYFFARGYDH